MILDGLLFFVILKIILFYWQDPLAVAHRGHVHSRLSLVIVVEV